ncbi:hypothetical protein E2C01_017169 [Portunus trituberculatus]|uniref:Uncharacterized protein n=1 Tax=Portunus trituberculatus TaxID=210409 RepID=A0A5B7DSF9_PORTR|nr:hypothetical protein [Portunus trituberculatus]
MSVHGINEGRLDKWRTRRQGSHAPGKESPGKQSPQEQTVDAQFATVQCGEGSRRAGRGGGGRAVQGCAIRCCHTVLLEHPDGAWATVPRNLSCGLHTQGPISGTHKGTNARAAGVEPCAALHEKQPAREESYYRTLAEYKNRLLARPQETSDTLQPAGRQAVCIRTHRRAASLPPPPGLCSSERGSE